MLLACHLGRKTCATIIELNDFLSASNNGKNTVYEVGSLSKTVIQSYFFIFIFQFKLTGFFTAINFNILLDNFQPFL